MAPSFRAEQIGSLLRPADLLAARTASDLKASYTPELPENVKKITRDAIASVIKQQISLSIRPLTSGEYERQIFYGGFFEKLQGFEVFPALPIPEGFRTDFPTIVTLQSKGIKTRPAVVATGKIKHVKSAYLEEWEVLKSLVPDAQWKECKITMPSPTWQHMQLAKGTAYSLVYSSDKEYFTDLAAAFKSEFLALYSAGLRSIQIDDPNLTFFLTSGFLAGCVKDGVDPNELLDLYIWAQNACLEGLPEDLHVGVHLCRGNMASSTHVATGSYEKIAKRIFTGLNYHTFYLEYDDPERAGDFKPLRHLPIGKNVILGVVSTKTAELEDLDELVERVHAAGDAIAKGQGRSRKEVLKDSLGVSPQCGFASMSEGGGVGMTEERMWEKLVLVRDLARRIWDDAV